MKQKCYLLYFNGDDEPVKDLIKVKINIKCTLSKFHNDFFRLMKETYDSLHEQNEIYEEDSEEYYWGPDIIDDIEIKPTNDYKIYICGEYFMINTNIYEQETDPYEFVKLSDTVSNSLYFPKCFTINYGTSGGWNTYFNCVVVKCDQEFIFKFIDENYKEFKKYIEIDNI